MKKNIIFLFVLIFGFFVNLDIVNAAEKVKTCEYEMYPPHYYVKKNKAYSTEMSKNSSMKVKITDLEKKNNKNTLQVEVSSSFVKNVDKKSKIDDNNVVKSMRNGKCPNYIMLTIGTDAKNNYATEYSSTNAFSSSIDNLVTKKGEISSSGGLINVPLGLIKQDGKVNSLGATFAANYIVNRWNTILSGISYPKSCKQTTLDMSTYGITNYDTFYGYVSGSYSKRSEKDKAMSEDCWNSRKEYMSYINNAYMVKKSIEKSDGGVLQKLEKNSTWTKMNSTIEKITKGSDYIDNKNQLDIKEDVADAANKDYCYFYCDKSHCGNLTNDTAKTQCISSCSSSEKTKCNEAYSSCQNIASDSDKTQCIKEKLTEYGLDSGYIDIRSEEMNKINSEITNLRTAISKVDKPALNIKFDTEGYKVQCSDVAFLHTFWVIIQIAAPILTILMGTIDFLMAVVASDENKMQKARKKFPKRLIAAVLLVLSFYIVSLILSFSYDSNVDNTSLIRCIVQGQ